MPVLVTKNGTKKRMDFIYFSLFVFFFFFFLVLYFDFDTRKDRSNWPSWHLIVTVSALFYRQMANKEKLRSRNESRNKNTSSSMFCLSPTASDLCLFVYVLADNRRNLLNAQVPIAKLTFLFLVLWSF